MYDGSCGWDGMTMGKLLVVSIVWYLSFDQEAEKAADWSRLGKILMTHILSPISLDPLYNLGPASKIAQLYKTTYITNMRQSV